MILRLVIWLSVYIIVLLSIDLFQIMPGPFGTEIIDNVEFKTEMIISNNGNQLDRASSSIYGEKYEYYDLITKKIGDNTFKIPTAKEVKLVDFYPNYPMVEILKLPNAIFQEWEVCINKLKTRTNNVRQFPPHRIGIFPYVESESAAFKKLDSGNGGTCVKVTDSGSMLPFKVLPFPLFPDDIEKPIFKNEQKYLSITTAEFVLQPMFKPLPILVQISVFCIIAGLVALIIKTDSIIINAIRKLFT